MTSVCVTRVPRRHYRFWHVARMEWIKLRTLRSTWWTMGIAVAGAVAIGVAVGHGTKNTSGDLTNNALAGLVPGLLLAGVLGVLAGPYHPAKKQRLASRPGNGGPHGGDPMVALVDGHAARRGDRSRHL
jgi:prepilin-type processing-associated H-X9-DG protein